MGAAEPVSYFLPTSLISVSDNNINIFLANYLLQIKEGEIKDDQTHKDLEKQQQQEESRDLHMSRMQRLNATNPLRLVFDNTTRVPPTHIPNRGSTTTSHHQQPPPPPPPTTQTQHPSPPPPPPIVNPRSIPSPIPIPNSTPTPQVSQDSIFLLIFSYLFQNSIFSSFFN